MRSRQVSGSTRGTTIAVSIAVEVVVAGHVAGQAGQSKVGPGRHGRRRIRRRGGRVTRARAASTSRHWPSHRPPTPATAAPATSNPAVRRKARRPPVAIGPRPRRRPPPPQHRARRPRPRPADGSAATSVVAAGHRGRHPDRSEARPRPHRPAHGRRASAARRGPRRRRAPATTTVACERGLGVPAEDGEAATSVTDAGARSTTTAANAASGEVFGPVRTAVSSAAASATAAAATPTTARRTISVSPRPVVSAGRLRPAGARVAGGTEAKRGGPLTRPARVLIGQKPGPCWWLCPWPWP